MGQLGSDNSGWQGLQDGDALHVLGHREQVERPQRPQLPAGVARAVEPQVVSDPRSDGQPGQDEAQGRADAGDPAVRPDPLD